MRTLKQVSVKVLDKVICDICGKDTKREFAEFHAAWGYKSDSDGKSFSIDFCEHCFYDTIAWLKIKSDNKSLDGKYDL